MFYCSAAVSPWKLWPGSESDVPTFCRSQISCMNCVSSGVCKLSSGQATECKMGSRRVWLTVINIVKGKCRSHQTLWHHSHRDLSIELTWHKRFNISLKIKVFCPFCGLVLLACFLKRVWNAHSFFQDCSKWWNIDKNIRELN